MNITLLSASALAQPAVDTSAIWTLQEENAAFSTQHPRDRQYTNGLRLGWTSAPIATPTALTDLWHDGETRFGIALSQQIYTPTDTQTLIANPHDRPYGGLLLGDLSLLHDGDNVRSIGTLSLGVAGPAAGGGDIQNGWHDLIHHASVKGWDCQIPNTPAAEGSLEQIWRVPTGWIGAMETDLLPALTLGIGDVRDYAQAGVNVRLGQGLVSDFGVPRLRPGSNGGDVYRPVRPFVWYVFAGVDGQAVAYDLMLQAGPFRGGPSVTPYWDVAEFQGGFAMMAFGARFTAAYVAQTPAFHGQTGGLHQFASFSVSLRF